MALITNTIEKPDEYPIIYYWRNDDYKTPIEIYDRFNKGVMYNTYNRERGCFEMGINSYTFNRGIFNSNNDLRKIQFTKSLQLITIANFAFEECSVEEIEFDGVGIIGTSFCRCDKLKRITVPECVERIAANAFASCDKLRNVNIKGAPMLGEYCFIDTPVSKQEYFGKCLYCAKDADSAYQTYKVKPGTKIIASDAFFETANIDKVIVPNSVLKIGYNAFDGCNVSDVVFNGCPDFVYVKEDSNSTSIFGNTDYSQMENITICDEKLFPTIQKDNIYSKVNVKIEFAVDSNGVIKK